MSKKDLREQLGIDDWLELVKEDKNLDSAYISFAQYMDILEKENKRLKEELKSVNKGLRKVISKRKKWKDKYYKVKKENRQLKEQLQLRDEVIEKTKKLIQLYGKYNGEKCTRGCSMWSADFNKILDILNKYKGDDKANG